MERTSRVQIIEVDLVYMQPRPYCEEEPNLRFVWCMIVTESLQESLSKLSMKSRRH